MIVLSCGHKVDSFKRAFDVVYKSFDEEGMKAVAYAMVCGPCEDDFRKGGVLFETQEDAEKWLAKG
jgi:hypothetical protein